MQNPIGSTKKLKKHNFSDFLGQDDFEQFVFFPNFFGGDLFVILEVHFRGARKASDPKMC